jgi:SAM-dependent methyltransferase
MKAGAGRGKESKRVAKRLDSTGIGYNRFFPVFLFTVKSPVSTYPRAHAVLAELRLQHPFLARSAETAHGTGLDERLPVLEKIAERLDEISDGPWIADAVKAYALLSLEFLKLQRKLEKTGTYLLHSERETFEQVYDNDEVLGFYYLAGLLLSQGLWPNHFGLLSAFEQFLPEITSQAHVLEIGVGTGFHLRELFERVPGVRYAGVDISRFAVAFAQRYAFGSEPPSRAEFTLQNATAGLSFADATFDFALCGEVVEHVENPAALLREILRTCKPGAAFYMTTAIYAASIDHIYLFESAQDVRDLIAFSGWTLERDWVFPVYAGDPEAPRKPAGYASILRKPA